jgi:hypothetical protein
MRARRSNEHEIGAEEGLGAENTGYFPYVAKRTEATF